MFMMFMSAYLEDGFRFILSFFMCRYYEFDHRFAREVLGKKLSKGTKKDLDDISSKTGIALKSCRRQVCQTSNRSAGAVSSNNVVIEKGNYLLTVHCLFNSI